MKSLKDIKKLVTKFNVKPTSEMKSKVLDEALKLQRNQNQQTTSDTNMWRIIMKSRMTKVAVAAVIIIAVLIGINKLGGSIDGAGVAWASVVEKLDVDIRSTNTIHALLTIRSESPKTSETAENIETKPVYLKGEQWLRREPMSAKTVIEGEQTTYYFEDTFIGLNHSTKTWFEQTLSKEQEKKKLRVLFDALVSGDFQTFLEVDGFTISDAEAVGHEIVAGKNTTIYEFVGVPADSVEDATKKTPMFRCWISNLDDRVVRLHQYIGNHDEPRISLDLIEYNTDIPAGIFDVVIPEGYTRQFSLDERTRMISPKDATDLRQAYDQAREGFPDYRMMVFDDKGVVKCQIARSENKWRRDFFDRYRQTKAGIFIDLSTNFDDLWMKTVELPKEYVESTYMTYGDKAAVGFWPKKGVLDLPQSKYTRLPDNSYTGAIKTFEQLVWPKIESISGPDANIRILPPSEEYPDCTAISLSYVPKRKYPIAVLLVYYIDPSRDYMCIRHERHQRKMPLWEENLNWEQNEPIVELEPNRYDNSLHSYHSTIVEITATAQSPDGKWYPSERLIQYYRIGENGERIKRPNSLKTENIYIDTKGQIDQNWLGWPEELVAPSK